MDARKDLHRIVIVGGGAGGLALAVRLGHRLGKRKRAEVVLVDGALTHLWKPLLHEVAAGTLDSRRDAVEFLAQARAHHFRFQLGQLIGLDRRRKEIHLAPLGDVAEGETETPQVLTYDTLIIAVGSTVNDFGVPGAKEHCTLFDGPVEAENFHLQFLIEHLRIRGHEAASRGEGLCVAIIGAGATGVELAAELHAADRQLVAYGLGGRTTHRSLKLVLFEAADRVLPGLPERVSDATGAQLGRIGVEIHTGNQVAEVTVEGVRTKSGLFVPCDMKVWAAGIKAPDVLRNLDGLETNRLNQLVVRQTLQTTLSDDIFAIGDCAACPWPGHDRPVPPRAQAADQQAKWLARHLPRHLEGKPLPDFVYKDRGSLISLSRYSTIGSLMGNLFGEVTFEGWLARIAYRSLYRSHQRTIYGLPRMTLIMLSDWLRRGAGPTLKLH